MKFLLLVIVTLSIVKFATTRTGVKWNKRSKTFEPISGLTTYEEEREKIISQSREQETYNFNGQPLNVTYYEDLGFFEYSDNDTKASGICGDMWTVLSKFMNFTLVLSKNVEPTLGVSFKNKTYGGLLEYARLNQTDVIPKMIVYITRIYAVEFGPVMWMNSQRIFAHGQWKPNRAWMFNLLSMETWAFIITFIVTLSLASIVTQRILIRHRGRKLERENFFDHFFYSFVTMCNQPSSGCNKTGSGSKMLNLTIGVFAFLTLTVYNSCLIYSMAKETFEAPFNDLETLLDKTNFNIVVLKGSAGHVTFESDFALPIFGRIKRSNRLTIVTDLDELYEKVCEYSNKYVMFEAEDSVATSGRRECNVIPVGIPYYLTPIAAGISRRVKNWKSLKIGMMILREYGVLDAMKKRYMRSTSTERVNRQAESLSIDMDRVLIIFGILGIGIVVSIIICVAENIVFTLNERKTVQRLFQRVSAIRQRPIFVGSMIHSCERNKG